MKYDFCKFKNSSDGKPAELFFYGDIVSDSWGAWTAEDQYPLNVQQLLSDIGSNDIDIHINSGGGDVFAGVAICNMLRSCTGKKTVYVDGLAASIASVIAMAGDEIIIPANAYMMIHKASTISIGNADDMRQIADTLDKIDAGIVATYMMRAQENITEKQFKKMMADETWLSGSEVAEYFNNIKVETALQAVASCDSKFIARYRNIPDGISEQKVENVPKPTQADVPEELEVYAIYAEAVKTVYCD